MSILDMDELIVAFKAHTAGKQLFTRRMAICLADMDGSTPKAVTLRLERLQLLHRGSWEWFSRNGGITIDHIKEARRAAGIEVREIKEAQ